MTFPKSVLDNAMNNVISKLDVRLAIVDLVCTSFRNSKLVVTFEKWRGILVAGI